MVQKRASRVADAAQDQQASRSSTKARGLYRAERRNEFAFARSMLPKAERKDRRWRGGAKVKVVEAAAIRANRRDRSEEAEARRVERNITMDFTGSVQGLSSALVNRALQTIHQKKPKRGWAALTRKAPWTDTTKEKERMRHKWYRDNKSWAALRINLGQEQPGDRALVGAS